MGVMVQTLETLGFIQAQLVRIEGKVDGLDTRLRGVERDLVNKIELEKLKDRVGDLETFRIKFIATAAAVIFIVQFAVHFVLKQL